MKYQGGEKLDTFIGSAAETAKIVKKLPWQNEGQVYQVWIGYLY